MNRAPTFEVGDQTGRTAVVTGANSGIGLKTTEALAKKGATVIMACRDQARGDAARASFAKEMQARTRVLLLDVASQASPQPAATWR